MKKIPFSISILLSAVFLLSCNSPKPSAEPVKDAVETDSVEKPVFSVEKGVNLSHWLSQCFGWSPRESFITEADIRFVDSIGMDHIRLPIDEEEMWNEDGTKIQESFDYMHQCIGWAKKYGLRVMVDLHIVRAHHFNAQNGEGKNTLFKDSLAQQNFVDLWFQLSEELKQYPVEFLAYEFLNEPVADDPEDWNKLIDKCYTAIRKLEPERYIVIGSNEWQTPRMFPFLRVPENDKRIILAFHYYEPLFITHYSAYWTSFKDYAGPVVYPGKSIPDSIADELKKTDDELLLKRLNESNRYYDKSVLAADLQPVFDKAKEYGLQVVCTEFGAYNKIDPELRKRYYSDIMAVFKENNVSWSIWDLKGDFGLLKYDRKNYVVTGIDSMVVETIMKD